MKDKLVSTVKNIYELPNDLEMKKAPIAEPTAVSLHAVELFEKSLLKPIKDQKILQTN